MWAQPINNDLTRIGAYPERWFGWNAPQKQPSKLKDSPPEVGKRKILVIGDSFSEAGHWQPYLSDKYSFSYVHIRHVDLDGLLKKIAAEKPDAIVLQSIERGLVEIFGTNEKLGSNSSHCNFPTTVAADHAVISSAQLVNAVQQLPVFPERSRSLWPTSLNSLSEGFHYLKTWLNVLAKPKARKARVFALDTARLFSSAHSNQLLVLSKDAALKKPATPEQIGAIHCGIQQVNDTLMALELPHVILLVPDKTTAYQPYLIDSELRNKSALIDRVQVDHLPHGINMLPALRSRLAAGQQDLYLPNDTHWGYAGHQVAAVLIEHELSTQWYHP